MRLIRSIPLSFLVCLTVGCFSLADPKGIASLNVSGSGTGAGSVLGDNAVYRIDIHCNFPGKSCSSTFEVPEGPFWVNLDGTPAPGSVLTSWEGCKSTESFPVCRVDWTYGTLVLGAREVTVHFDLSSPQSPAIALNRGSLTYQATQGGASPAFQSVTITNSSGGRLTGLGLGTLSYGLGPTGWMQALTLSGTTADPSVELTLRTVTGSLAAGTYTATVPVQSLGASNSPQDVTVTLIVAPPAPAIALSPASLSYNATQGGANPASQLITITNSGGGTLSGLNLGAISYGPGATGWLQAPTLNSTIGPATLTVQPVTGTLTPGTYAATVPVLSTTASNSPQDLAITLVVAAAACTIIEDQFVADAGWTTTAAISAGSPTQTVTYQAGGGNPGGYREMRHIFASGGALAVFHYYGTTRYDPSKEGAIDHLNYSEDQIEINPPFSGAAVGTGFTMMQGGTRYSVILRPPGGAFTNTIWETTSRLNLKAADFPGVNFSSTGGPITFGYFRSNTSGSARTLTHGIDNWKVEICR